jgi:hypothetical protein
LAKETPPRGQAGSHGTEALHEALRGLDVEHEALPLVAEGLDVEHEAPLTTGDVEHEALPRVTGDLSGWQRNNLLPHATGSRATAAPWAALRAAARPGCCWACSSSDVTRERVSRVSRPGVAGARAGVAGAARRRRGLGELHDRAVCRGRGRRALVDPVDVRRIDGDRAGLLCPEASVVGVVPGEAPFGRLITVLPIRFVQ